MLKPLVNALLAGLGYRIDRRIAAPDAAPDSLEGALAMTQGMVSLEEARLLHELARDARGGCIVEVGSFRGRSAVALARGAADGHGAEIYAVDPHAKFKGALGGEFGPEDRAAFMRAMLDTGAYRQVALVNLSSEVAAAGWTAPIALLWIDGDHSVEGTRRDYECWSPHLVEGGLIALDDSLDADLGPARLVAELLAAGSHERVRVVGKITVLRPVGARG